MVITLTIKLIEFIVIGIIIFIIQKLNVLEFTNKQIKIEKIASTKNIEWTKIK